jgi:DNA-binding transcriptional LysR family regulator
MDLAIRMGQGDWQDVKSTNLVVEKLQPVCAPSLAGRIRASTDLAGQTLLHVTGIADDWATWARLADVQSLDLTQGLRFDTIDMAMEAAARGMGIAIGRFPLIVGDLEVGRLVPILGPERPCRTGYWLLAPREALVRAEVALFRDWICAELKQPISPSAIHRPA